MFFELSYSFIEYLCRARILHQKPFLGCTQENLTRNAGYAHKPSTFVYTFMLAKGGFSAHVKVEEAHICVKETTKMPMAIFSHFLTTSKKDWTFYHVLSPEKLCNRFCDLGPRYPTNEKLDSTNDKFDFVGFWNILTPFKFILWCGKQ